MALRFLIAMRLVLAHCSVPIVLHAFAQAPEVRLRAELERIREQDQADRHAVHDYTTGPQKDSVIAHMARQDSLDLVRVTFIIDSAGWLGEDVIGQQANQALFLVIQHADRQPDVQARYLPVMREAVANGAARANELAMLEDRVRVNAGREQLYGSQIGWKDDKPFVRPIEDEVHVNERRASVGLEPLEKYAERFGIQWTQPVERPRVLLFGPTTP